MAKTCREFASSHGDPVLFDIAFQPIFDMRDGSVLAYEALVRGPNGEPAASVLGRVDGDERFAFEHHLRLAAIRKASALGLAETSAALTLNVTPSIIGYPEQGLAELSAAAAEARLSNGRIIFECTEDVRIDMADARRLLEAYCRNGFLCALDDFGAGYHGLLLLANLETDFVKLDMGLIRDIDRSKVRRRIVAAMAALLRDLGREVIAEGIETAGELAVVQQLGISLVQGFHLGKPSRLDLQTQPCALDHAA